MPPDALSADDAKCILQGGYLAIPQKHKEPSNFIFKSPAYITCNEIPSFSDVDSTAIEARLEVFQTRSLPKKNPNATTWFRIHCMDCFHWAAERLRGVPIFDDEAFGDLKAWNEIPMNIRELPTLYQYKKQLKSHLMS